MSSFSSFFTGVKHFFKFPPVVKMAAMTPSSSPALWLVDSFYRNFGSSRGGLYMWRPAACVCGFASCYLWICLPYLLLKTRGRPTGLGGLKCGADFFLFSGSARGNLQESVQHGSGVRLLTGPCCLCTVVVSRLCCCMWSHSLSLLAPTFLLIEVQTDALRRGKGY